MLSLHHDSHIKISSGFFSLASKVRSFNLLVMLLAFKYKTFSNVFCLESWIPLPGCCPAGRPPPSPPCSFSHFLFFVCFGSGCFLFFSRFFLSVVGLFSLPVSRESFLLLQVSVLSSGPWPCQ